MRIEDTDLLGILYALIDQWENEVVEFKEAGNDFRQGEIGQYFSAISNEANLKNLQYGWLIFGVKNKRKIITGTSYRNTAGLEKLKHEISQNTTGGISFIDIFEVYPEINGRKIRVIMFKIPAAAAGIPTGWNNHFYGRNGESLGALGMNELDKIRNQYRKDWSKQIIENSSIKYLDGKAISAARRNYKKKNKRSYIRKEIDDMTDEEFLTKIKLIVNRKLTNAAMIMLGNSDYDYIMDFPPRIMWRLYGQKNNDKDHEEFTIPFINIVDTVYAKIRNLTYRYMPNQLTLFPEETAQYDTRMFRELINNCIAHQDYTIGGRIYVDEFEDKIIISNPGNFLPGDVRDVLKPGYTAPYYRNQLLAETMVNFNMIETAAMGIRMIYNIQKNKFFPLPDYDISKQEKVAVTVYGKVMDENYTKILFKNPQFDLDTVFMVDRVQKKLRLEKEARNHLRRLGVIEGKSPHLFLSANIAEILDEKAQYIKNKGFDNEYYKKMIIEYLKKYNKATKADFRKLLLNKLSEVLDDRQKEKKIRNLLGSLQKKGIIMTDNENKRLANWILAKLD